MNIKINSVHFDTDKRLEQFIEKKITKLGRMSENVLGVEVFLRLSNTPSIENKITEIKLEIPGGELFAKKQTKTFEESTDTAVEALRKQLEKHKGKK